MNKGSHCRECHIKAGTKARRFATKGYLLFIILLCILASNNIIKRISCCAKQISNEATQEIFSNSINFDTRKPYNSHLANHEIHTSKIFSSNSDEYDDSNDDKTHHPIIVYKYDIIDENNDKLQLDEDLQESRDRESYTLLKPKKIYFDFMPNKPLLYSEEKLAPKTTGKQHNIIEASAGKFKEGVIIRKNTKHYQQYNYHDRKKRDIEPLALRNLQKRTPRFDYLPPICTNCATDKTPIQQLINYIKHAVPGKKHNALDIPVPAIVPRMGVMPDMNVSIDSRIAADENERVIFSAGRKPNNRPKANRRPPEVIYREPRPPSFMNGREPSSFQANRFVPSSPSSASDFPPTNSRPTAAAPERKVSITQCVWAIVNCCSSNSNEIRYSCFERNGCFGAFWDLNPCAVEVLDSVVTFVGDYYE